MASIQKISDIVENGLCIGCGLCQSIAGPGPERIKIVMTPGGVERPVAIGAIDDETFTTIKTVCPGTRVTGPPDSFIEPETIIDPIWGAHLPSTRTPLLKNGIARGYATDPEIRFKAANGGMLTALTMFLLEKNIVDFAAHVKASKQYPMQSETHLSFDRTQLLRGAASRYAPAAPLVNFMEVLDMERPFVLIGKPCDLTAIRQLAHLDPRIDKYCKYFLTFFCGGASELGKSQDLLEEYGIQEDELATFRYRGHGNPGPTYLETKTGNVFKKNFNDFWGEEPDWRIQFRCKICPDPNGEVADLAAFDTWPNTKPEGDDEGFNGIMARNRKGLELLEAAIESGILTIDKAFTLEDLDLFQPHQVRKRKAIWARLEGLRQAGQPVPEVSGLRIEELAQANSPEVNQQEMQGTLKRAKAGRTKEPPARLI